MVYYTLFDQNESKVYQKETAKKLLRFALIHEYNIDIDTLDIKKGEHGKPFFSNHSDIKLNISHCKGLATCILNDDSDVGIDAEKITRYHEKICSRVFSQNEILAFERAENKDLHFFKLWTLKEAFVKCIGIGISYPLKTVSFDFLGDTIIFSENGYNFTQKIIDDSFVISVCNASSCNDLVFNFVPNKKF